MTSEEIKNIVNKEFETDVSLKLRKRDTIDAKRVYVKLCREHTLETYDKIGKTINCNHATILHHYKHRNIIQDVFKLRGNMLIEKYDLNAEKYDVSRINYGKAFKKDLNIKKTDLNENELFILDSFKELSNLNDSELTEFKETRLKPFLRMLESRKTHKNITNVVGETIKR